MHSPQIKKRIKEIINEIDPSAEVFLFGSRAKGKWNKESDWDVLILIDKEVIDLEEERKYTYPLYNLEFQISQIISPKVYSKQSWRTKYHTTPFYENVMEAAIPL